MVKCTTCENEVDVYDQENHKNGVVAQIACQDTDTEWGPGKEWHFQITCPHMWQRVRLF